MITRVIRSNIFAGIKALNKTHMSSISNISDTRGGEGVAFVTVFTVYNTSVDGRSSDSSIVGKVSYNKVERSMAVLNTFINFIQVHLKIESFLRETYSSLRGTVDGHIDYLGF